MARDAEAAEQRRSSDRHLAENLRGYRDFAKQPDTIATLVDTWVDEPLTWRRSWVWRFIGRVEVAKKGRSSHDVAIHYLDGQVSHLVLNLKGDVTAEEWGKLWTHPEEAENGLGCVDLRSSGRPRV